MLGKWSTTIAVGGCVLLAACQTQNPSSPVTSRASAPSTSPATFNAASQGGESPVSLDGWSVNKTLMSPSGDPALITKICLQKAGDAWTSNSTFALPGCDDLSRNGAESVILDFGSRTVTLDAVRPTNLSAAAQRAKTGTAPDSTEWECFYGLGGTSVRIRASYNACASELVSSTNVASSIGGVLNLAVGTARSVVGIDAQKVLAALAQANAISKGQDIIEHRLGERLKTSQTLADFEGTLSRYEKYVGPEFRPFMESLYKKDVEARQLAAYRTAYAGARSAEDFRQFSALYASYDPDNLVPTATAKANDLENKARREADAAQAKRASDLASFRSKLSSGDDTHCGMVIAVNGAVVKVQAMIGEYWFRRDQLFPPATAPCRFVNGVYQQ